MPESTLTLIERMLIVKRDLVPIDYADWLIRRPNCNCLLKNVPSKSVYGDTFIDKNSYVVSSNGALVRIVILAPEFDGCLNEKIPFLYLSAVAAIEPAVIIVLAGSGYQEQAVQWLRDSAKNRFSVDSNTKKIWVMTSAQFSDWLDTTPRTPSKPNLDSGPIPVTQYTFGDQISFGLQGVSTTTLLLSKAFGEHSLTNVEDVSEYQKKDIDLICKTPTGTLSFEVKTDKYHTTGNFAFETFSSLELKTPGCFMYTEADVLCYVFPGNSTIYWMPVKRTREWFKQTMLKWPVGTTTTPFKNNRKYTTQFRKVPIRAVLQEVQGASQLNYSTATPSQVEFAISALALGNCPSSPC